MIRISPTESLQILGQSTCVQVKFYKSLNLNFVPSELKAWHNGSLGILDAAKNKAGSDELEDC